MSFSLQLYFIPENIRENVCIKVFGIKVFMSHSTGLNVRFIIIISSAV